MKIICNILLLLTVFSPDLHAENCPVSEREILGAWSREGDQGFFEEFSLATDSGSNDFSSWLHHRPEIFGAAWEIKDCRLLITGRHNEFPPFQLKILGLEQDLLHLYDESENAQSVYKRIPSQP